MTISVIVADDHQIVREGVRRILQSDPAIEVVAEAANAAEVHEAAMRTNPDVILLDLRMPGDGIQAARRVKAALPSVKVVALTAYDDSALVMAAVRNEFDGYLLKDTLGEDIIRAVKAVTDGRKVASAAITEELFAEVQELYRAPQDEAPLTLRQKRILERIAQGTSSVQIARELFVSEATVKRDTYILIKRLHAQDRAEAVAKALRRGII